MAEIAEDAELTADEILTFGPCVEAQVWTPIWIAEARAPIAVMAGRPKLGRVFNDDGVGKAVIIRPCVSRGRRVRGLAPIYTPQMLEANAGVFTGWPMFTDHCPPEVAAALGKTGRSVKELGGQVLKAGWARDHVHEDDSQYGYRKGGVLAEVWATPFVRKLVGENPNLLHTSINAWPTSGKPGPVPWRPALKGMVIEGIRKQPQGSVDYVVRGGAGGRLLVAEGVEDEGAWPELGEWTQEDKSFVVSLAESFYASRQMADVTLPTKPGELKDWLAEHAPHLLPALQESSQDDKPKPPKQDDEGKPAAGGTSGLTEEDVKRILAESQSGAPTLEEFEQKLTERTDQVIQERDEQRALSARASALIETAEGIPTTWKTDLKARYAMLPSGPPATLLVESAVTDKDGNELTAEQIIDARVREDLDHTRDLIAEATGKPRVKGEGGAKRDPSETSTSAAGKREQVPFWRSRFVSMRLAESEDKAVEAFGGKVPEKVGD